MLAFEYAGKWRWAASSRSGNEADIGFSVGVESLESENRVANSCGALNVFVNVATIRSDAFWFSAVP